MDFSVFLPRLLRRAHFLTGYFHLRVDTDRNFCFTRWQPSAFCEYRLRGDCTQVRRPFCVRMDFQVAYGSNELIPNSGNYSVQRLGWLCKFGWPCVFFLVLSSSLLCR